MNKTMQSMMKPIPVDDNSRAVIRQAQEDRVLSYLQQVNRSVSCKDVQMECHGIPEVESTSGYYGQLYRRTCSKILQRLEKKGHVVSVLYGSYRYYSIPVQNGGEN